MPGLNQPIDAFPRMAKMAEDAGFDSVWDYEFYRNPLVIHGMTAQATSTIPLGTGLVTTAGRSPFVMANAAADVDEASGGRLILGISTGAAAFTDLMNGADSNRPAARTREYVTLLRKIWDWTAGDGVTDGETFGGQFYKFTAPEINPFGRRPLARKRIPIYTAALRQTMARLGGEISDGVIGFMLPTRYLREVYLPSVAEGAHKAGRDLADVDVDVASETVCSVSNDRAEAYRRARLQVGIYISHPVCAPLAEYMGLAKDREVCLEAMAARGPMALAEAVSDELVDAFSITGTPDECRRKLEEYSDCLPHVLLHPPYMPVLTQEESEDAYGNIISTFGR
ncbi:LLM class flavin-dependent oxidoreductase [Mycolicibacterium stellerae]|uniref:LLM class flavin-dependent oxidoreductase n=1 Tax=Mycolicibacterium stellerae TaxID=2358193 RepID=UPI0022857F3C|nr:LLM class flavin-dependent oxidoreductase [Mycolicibacterium stellerae]